MSSSPVIVVITVNSNETAAVFDLFLGERGQPKHITKAWLIYNDLGKHGGNVVFHIISEMGAGGIGASQQRSWQAIAHLRPTAIIAVGVAFGMDETKQEIGEVLVSKQIQDYELGRLNEGGKLSPRGDRAPCSDMLLNRFRNADAEERRRDETWPKISFGLIISGQKLIDSLDTRENLKALFPEAIGGEMEATGLYVGASAAKTHWIVVKAICDWGHDKNHSKKEEWQKLAARNAARVLKAGIDTGILEDRGPSFPMTDLQNANPPGAQQIRASVLPTTCDHLVGREDGLDRLTEAWENPAVHILTFVAWRGVGKTSLVARWQADLGKCRYDGASFFDWSFYSQGTRDQGAASADTFIIAALEFFGGVTGKEFANSAASPWDKGARLAQFIGEQRTLLILDGLEPLQYPPASDLRGQLKDPALLALLKGLAARNPGLCVVTSRERLTDLASFRNSTAPEFELGQLSIPAGICLLKNLGVKGAQRDFEELVNDVQGHALTLTLLGRYLAEAYLGDIRCRDSIRFEEADAAFKTNPSDANAEKAYGHAFKVMAAYERWLLGGNRNLIQRFLDLLPFTKKSFLLKGRRQVALLRLLGLFDRPASVGSLKALLNQPVIPGLTERIVGLNDTEWNRCLSALAGCGLISLQPNPFQVQHSEHRIPESVDAHPLIREYYANQLKEKNLRVGGQAT